MGCSTACAQEVAALYQGTPPEPTTQGTWQCISREIKVSSLNTEALWGRGAGRVTVLDEGLRQRKLNGTLGSNPGSSLLAV